MSKINLETQEQIANVQRAYTALQQIIVRYENTLAVKHELKEEADRKFSLAKHQLMISLSFLIDGLCLLGEEKDES